MNVSQNSDTAGRRLWFRRFAEGSTCRITLILTSLLFIGCGNSTSGNLIEKADAAVKRHDDLATLIKELGAPNNTNQNPSLGMIIEYFDFSDHPSQWNGQLIGGVQIVITNGRADKMFPVFRLQ